MSAFERSCTLGVGMIVALLAGGVSAQTPIVTAEDIARVRRETPTVTDDNIRRAREKHSMPAAAGTPAAPGPRLDALPQPLSGPAPDIAAIAQGYAANAHGLDGAQALAAGPGLFVFVSLTMPAATLQGLVDQAARAGASVFIRGFTNGSLRETVARVHGLIGHRSVAVQIDPQAFDRFAVTRVPSFVLVRDGARPAACASGTCPPAGDFVRTAGDVSLDYALEYMQRAAPRFQPEAGTFLARLKP